MKPKLFFKACNMATAVVAALTCLCACEQSLPLYNEPQSKLNFYYKDVYTQTPDYFDAEVYTDRLSRTAYSFIYAGNNVQRDTLWFEVESMGFVQNTDRPIALVQVDTTALQAQPGVHYVDFNDEQLKKFYIMPARKARTKLPVVVLRHPSLQQGDVILKFAIAPNNYFQPGYEPFTTRRLTISATLSKPVKWDYFNETTWKSVFYAYGEYGKVKHQFLIEASGERWDDDFIVKIVDGDTGYFDYLHQKMVEKLDQLNNQRAQQGLPPLAEADGTPVALQ